MAIEPVSYSNKAMNQTARHQALGLVGSAAGPSWQVRMCIHIDKTPAMPCTTPSEREIPLRNLADYIVNTAYFIAFSAQFH